MRHTLIRTAAVALALTAIGAPAAVAQEGGGSWTPPRDMRSPDARDAAEGRGTFNSPDVANDGGVDWADAGIGAGILGGIVVLAGGGVLVVQRRSTAAA